jgi:hypothetical protein
VSHVCRAQAVANHHLVELVNEANYFIEKLLVRIENKDSGHELQSIVYDKMSV